MVNEEKNGRYDKMSSDQKKRMYAYNNALNKAKYKRTHLNMKADVHTLIEHYVKREYPNVSFSNYLKLLVCRDMKAKATTEEFEKVIDQIFGDITAKDVEQYINVDYIKQ